MVVPEVTDSWDSSDLSPASVVGDGRTSSGGGSWTGGSKEWDAENDFFSVVRS